MKKLLFIFFLLSIIISHSQEVIAINKHGFTFNLIKVTNESQSKIIEIKIYKDSLLLQTIIPEDNNSYASFNNQSILEFKDLNFDSHIDIRMVKYIPYDNMSYLNWIFNPKNKLFERNIKYDKITFPKFNKKKKEITSISYGYLLEIDKNTYTVKNNELIHIERYFEVIKKPGKKKFEQWKLIDGKFKKIKEGIIPLYP